MEKNIVCNNLTMLCHLIYILRLLLHKKEHIVNSLRGKLFFCDMKTLCYLFDTNTIDINVHLASNYTKTTFLAFFVVMIDKQMDINSLYCLVDNDSQTMLYFIFYYGICVTFKR